MSSSQGRKDPSRTETISPSPLQISLVDARRVLWSGRPFAGGRLVLDPMRIFVLDPMFAVNSVLLPLIVPTSLNSIFARCVDSIGVPILSLLYPQPSNAGGTVNNNDDTSLTQSAKLSIGRPTVIAVRPPSDFQSAYQGAIAFLCSALGDIAGILSNPKKFQGWVSAIGQFNTFLQQSGVGGEMEEAIQKPLLGGRLLDNFKILNDVQELCNGDRIEKSQIDDPIKRAEGLDNDIRDGHRLMRYATAAYGSEMVRSAVDSDIDASEFLHNDLNSENPFRAIAIHTKLPDECILFVHAGNDHDYDKHVLHHFCAVDHTTKSVVLAIRGTLSLSGAIVDIQGMATPFCPDSGVQVQAHKGIADMALNLWAQSGHKIQNVLEKYPDYNFVITGHSLGAGTSCLLIMYLCLNQMIPESRQIKCYAFAPPPTFFINVSDSEGPVPLTSKEKVNRAIQNTVAYIHDNDVVPFLSVASVRRLINLLDTVDNETEHIWFWNRWRIFYEYDPIPTRIKSMVVKVEDEMLEGRHNVCTAVDGECNMVIPARRVVWCKHNASSMGETKFEAFSCDPKKVAMGNIFLTPDMLSDHLPEQYEDALDDCLAQLD